MSAQHRDPAPSAAALVAALLALTAALPHAAESQLPGLPVLQGAFPAPGLAAGVNGGRTSGRTMVAGAIGYGPDGGRFGLTAGLGTFDDAAPGYRGSRLGYGARFALTVVRFANQRLAVTPFGGFGSARATLANASSAGLPADSSNVGKTIQFDEIPLGVAVGWRLALGETRAVALSVAPIYALARRTGSATDESASNLRVATVADVAVSTRLGVTLGWESGQTSSATAPGARASSLGVGVSFRIRR